MTYLPFVLTVAHLIGLALAVGGATVKLFLLLKCSSDTGFLKVYISVARIITRQIIVGMVLLTLSGVGWLLLGIPFTTRLTVKVILVAAIWALGPVIDNVIEPRFRKLAPEGGVAASAEFIRVQKQYVAVEVVATSLFYLIIVIWVWI